MSRKNVVGKKHQDHMPRTQHSTCDVLQQSRGIDNILHFIYLKHDSHSNKKIEDVCMYQNVVNITIMTMLEQQIMKLANDKIIIPSNEILHTLQNRNTEKNMHLKKSFKIVKPFFIPDRSLDAKERRAMNKRLYSLYSRAYAMRDCFELEEREDLDTEKMFEKIVDIAAVSMYILDAKKQDAIHKIIGTFPHL